MPLLFENPKVSEVELFLPERADIWRRVTHGMKVDEHIIVRPFDIDRRNRCKNNLQLYAETYFSKEYYDPCDYHVSTLNRLQEQILLKDVFVFKTVDAAPRSLGKTTLRRIAACWVISYIHDQNIFFGCHNKDNAYTHLEQIKKWFYEKQILRDDFPEICNWIMKIKNEPKRSGNNPWSNSYAVFQNGVVVMARGIGAGVVGLNVGSRPGVIFLDDIETVETAESKAETKKIGDIIDKQICHLHDTHKRAVYDLTGTVRNEECNLARYTDPDRSPGWIGKRTKGIIEWPQKAEMWEKFLEIFRNKTEVKETKTVADEAAAAASGIKLKTFNLIESKGHKDALRYYAHNKKVMDKGACLIDPIHLPLIKCMTILAENEKSFYTEIQNEPYEEDIGDVVNVDQKWIMQKTLKGFYKGFVPRDYKKITVGIDVGGYLKGCHWVAIAWGNGKAHIFDYGVFKPLSNTDIGVIACLDEFNENVLKRGWKLQGVEERNPPANKIRYMDFCFVDSQWMTDGVEEFCRGAGLDKFKAIQGCSISQRTHKSYRSPRKRSPQIIRLGKHWHEENLPHRKHFVRLDADYFKRLLHIKLKMQPDEKGGMTLYDTPPRLHKDFAKHIVAEGEKIVHPAGKGEMIIWTQHGRVNDLLDASGYAVCAADYAGMTLEAEAPPPKITVSLEDYMNGSG